MATIKSVTIEDFCIYCHHVYEVSSSDLKTGRHKCDCDWPCGCPSGNYLYIEHKCPKCGKDNRTFIKNLE